MIFDRSGFGIIFRVFLLLIWCVLLAYLLVSTSWFFTPLVTFIALLISTGELIYFLNRQQRELRNFLIAVKQGGYNTHYTEKGAFDKVFKIFNEIISSFQNLALEKEAEHQFLLLLTENMQAGLICFDESGEVVMLNPTAKQFIGKPLLHKVGDLEKYQPSLHRTIMDLPPGQSDVVKLSVGNAAQEIHVHKKLISSGSSEQTLILLLNIQQQMDVHEFDSWQKLTKVMRHEIMNSLTPIVGLSEAINKLLGQKSSRDIDDDTYDDIRESIGAIESRSKALIRFVNAYKNFANTPELHKSSFAVGKVFSKIHQLMEEQLTSKNVTLHAAGDSVMVEADESLLEGVLLNLVKNAVEASAENSHIHLTAESTGQKVVLSVADQGHGIGEDQLDKIFIPFFTTKKSGSGIGLSLARKIVQLHGGRIYAYNNSDGGLTLTLEM